MVAAGGGFQAALDATAPVMARKGGAAGSYGAIEVRALSVVLGKREVGY